MRLARDTRTAYAAMALCLVVACWLRWLGHTAIGHISTEVLSFSCYACLFLVWMRLTRQRFIRREVTGCLIALAALMLMWRLAQTIKYDFVVDMPDVSRWLWYAFYVPITFTPALLFLAILYVGMPESWRAGRIWWLLFAIAGVLSVLVLTNDLHQLAFRFVDPIGEEAVLRQDEDYTHGLAFYVVWGWVIVLGVLSAVVLVRRSARAGLLRRLLVPLAIAIAIGVLVPAIDRRQLHVFYLLFSFTDSACVLMLAFAESLLALGFFPTNSGYGALWRASSLGGGFVDGEGRLLGPSSKDTPAVTEAQVREALARPLMLGDGTSELAAIPVKGGTAFWVRDHSAVLALTEQLEDLGDALVQEQEMLNSELELALNRETVAQRQELYERVSANTAPQLAALEAALDVMPEDEDAFLAAMRVAAVYATYIKRSANLTFLGASGSMDARELALAFEETCACLRGLGADATVTLSATGDVRSDDALRAYAAFERLVEGALPGVAEAHVEGAVAGDSLVIRASVRGDASESLSCGLELAGDAP